jgi:hypothetical protein
MGMAPVAHVVWNKFMTFNPKNPDWVNRDRFVLSYVFSRLFKLQLRGLRQWLAADCGARFAQSIANLNTFFRGMLGSCDACFS